LALNVLRMQSVLLLRMVNICLVVMETLVPKLPPPVTMLMKVRKNSIPVVEPLDNVVPSI